MCGGDLVTPARITFLSWSCGSDGFLPHLPRHAYGAGSEVGVGVGVELLLGFWQFGFCAEFCPLQTSVCVLSFEFAPLVELLSALDPLVAVDEAPSEELVDVGLAVALSSPPVTVGLAVALSSPPVCVWVGLAVALSSPPVAVALSSPCVWLGLAVALSSPLVTLSSPFVMLSSP